jgi:hypothetical protein
MVSSQIGLSPRAASYLSSVAARHASVDAEFVRQRFVDRLPPTMLETLVAFEVEWGGTVIDPEGLGAELGIARLAERGVEPEVVYDPELLVLVGFEPNTDLYLSAAGALFWRANDPELVLLSTSVPKYIERLAALRSSSARALQRYFADGDRSLLSLVDPLGLEYDDAAADRSFARYASHSHVLIAEGDPPAITLGAASLDAMVRALLAAAELPEPPRCVVGTSTAVQEERMEEEDAPTSLALRDELGVGQAALHTPEPDGVVVVFTDPPRVEVVESRAQKVKSWLTLTEQEGTLRRYVRRWGGSR